MTAPVTMLSEYRRHRPVSLVTHLPNVPADGIARRYGDLVGLLRMERRRQELSQLALDWDIQEILATEGAERGWDGRKWQDGYCGKVERPDTLTGRSVVYPQFDLWLAGLGVGLRVVKLGL